MQTNEKNGGEKETKKGPKMKEKWGRKHELNEPEKKGRVRIILRGI